MSQNEILLHTQQCLCFFSDTALCLNNARKQYMDQNPNVQNQKLLFLGFKPLRLYYSDSIAALIVFFFFPKISKFSVIYLCNLTTVHQWGSENGGPLLLLLLLLRRVNLHYSHLSLAMIYGYRSIFSQSKSAISAAGIAQTITIIRRQKTSVAQIVIPTRYIRGLMLLFFSPQCSLYVAY